MKIVLCVVVIMLLVGVKLYVDRKNYKKRMRKRLLREWGSPIEDEYSTEKLQAVAEYYRDHEPSIFVDDITWNDLDMNRVYQQMNHTKSAMGQEYLYYLLRCPVTDPKELEERERLISFFRTEEEARYMLQGEFATIGKSGNFSVYGYLDKINLLKRETGIFSIIQFVAFIGGVISCFFVPDMMIMPTAVIAAVNMVTYYKRKAQMEQFYRLFAFVVRMIRFSETVSAMKIKELQTYFDRMKEKQGKFRKFCRGSWLVVGGGRMEGNITDILMDYVRLLTHIDIIKFQSMAREVLRLQKDLMDIYETVGFLDSMIATASYRDMMQEWCVPKMEQAEGRAFYLEADEIYHPLLQSPVKNTIHAHRNVLLTGSNASGKSTFIKTVAINAILAQTVHTVLADRYEAVYFRVYSSMALRDDILSSESYYMVEIKSLKRIVDRAKEEGEPVLCFIDEVLRGTNTVERIAASTEILSLLAQKNALCFAATHDIELTELLKEQYDNYHFEEQVEEDDVIFDYRLREGKAMTRNAIKLLHMIGYDQHIVQRAQERVENFVETGSWKM
ncbi:hypothetical protein [Jutongia sp.]|uniref:MutS-related protein n=1 Tax=Jutongia sp. TaxID=2944204 RepID=UPI0030800C49